METVGLRQLKDHLSEYVRRVRGGEGFLVSSHGEVVAELRAPGIRGLVGIPAGLRQLERRGAVGEVVPNDPARYAAFESAVPGLTARELLEWDRDER